MVEDAGEEIVLKRPDGKSVKVPLSKLSKADVEYVNNIRKQSPAEENPFAIKEDAPAEQDDADPAAKADKAATKSGGENVLLNNPNLYQGYRESGLIVENFGDVIIPATPSIYLGFYGSRSEPISVSVLNVLTSEQSERFELSSRVEASALSPDGKLFAYLPSDSKQRIKIHQTSDGKLFKELDLPFNPGFTSKLYFVDASTILVQVIDNGLIAFGIDVASGRKKFEMRTQENSLDRDTARLSPDGKLFVLKNYQSIVAFEVKTGKQKWSTKILPPNAKDPLKIVRFDFYKDSFLIGAICESYGESKLYFSALTSKDGRTAALKALTIPYEQHNSMFMSHKGRLIHSLDAGKTLLFGGTYLIDSAVGGPIWSNPDPEAYREIILNYIIAPNQQLVLQKKSSDYQFTLQEFAGEAMDQARMALQQGKRLEDASLPPLKEIDVTKAVRLGDPGARMVFKTPPAPKPVRHEPFFLDLNVQLFGTRECVLFSDSTIGKVAVVYDDGRNKTTTHVSLVDLASHAVDSQLELPQAGLPLALSPEAKYLALSVGEAGDRIDIYNLADQQHVVGFRPYKQLPPGTALSAVFVDEQTLVTYPVHEGVQYIKSPATTLEKTAIAWKFPTLEPIYQFNYTRIFRSPNRQLFAIPTKKGILFRASKSGEPLGYLNNSTAMESFQLKHFAISEDNFKCAAFEESLYGGRILLWDMKTSDKTIFNEPIVTTNKLSWSGDKQLIFYQGEVLDPKSPTYNPTKQKLELGLYSLERQRLMWGYTLQPEMHFMAFDSIDCPDGQYWRCDRNNERNAVTLAGYKIPSPQVMDQLAKAPPPANLIQPNREFLLKTTIGMTGNKTSDDLLSSAAKDTLAETLKRLNCKASDAAVDTLELVVLRLTPDNMRSNPRYHDGGIQVVLQSGNIANPSLWREELFLPFTQAQRRGPNPEEQKQMWTQILNWTQLVLNTKPTYDPLGKNARGNSVINGAQEVITQALQTAP